MDVLFQWRFPPRSSFETMLSFQVLLSYSSHHYLGEVEKMISEWKIGFICQGWPCASSLIPSFSVNQKLTFQQLCYVFHSGRAISVKSKNFSMNKSILVNMDWQWMFYFSGGSHLGAAMRLCFYFRFYCLTVLIIALVRWKE